MTTQQADKAYIAATYARFPVTLVGGKGAELFDADGKRYVDMGSGIGVNIFGTADEQWADVVSAQLKKLAHASNLYYTEPCARLAEKLCLKSGMRKVFFANSGAEANECAIKTARKWAAENKGAEYYNIITLKDGFHGRTLATLAATAQDSLHKDFLPLTAGFVYSAANDLEALEKAATENKCAAIMFETVQGEGGVLPLSPEFVRGAAETAAKHNLLLIVDEVQTGVGRTGKFYSFMHFGISTFGGNPAVCAGAEVVVDRLTDEFLDAVAAKGERVRKALEGAAGISEITGMGLMIGVRTARPVADVLADLRSEGVLALKAHDKLRLLPPLNISDELLDEAVEKIKKVCAK